MVHLLHRLYGVDAPGGLQASSVFKGDVKVRGACYIQWWSRDIFFRDRDIGQDRGLIETWDEPRHFSRKW